MTPSEKKRAFEKAQRALLRAQVGLLNDASAEIRGYLAQALTTIRSQLAGQPSDYQQWQLPQIEAEIERTLNATRNVSQAAAQRRIIESWAAGINAIDQPLIASRLIVAGMLPQISYRQLDAIKSFMTDRLRDATADAVNKINADLGLVMIGAQSPSQAVTNITTLLEGTTRERAVTIVRTELGRAYSVAGQARMSAAAELIPMDKVWRRSGKPRQRVGHALADGQRVDANEKFKIADKDGVIVEMMYPRDPTAPAGETINCGCVAIAKPREWKSTTPDHVPFRADELANNVPLRTIVAPKPFRPANA